MVGLIVKMDDIGLHLASGNRAVAGLGRGWWRHAGGDSLLSNVGTAAMLWVGGGIIVHGLDHFGLSGVEQVVEGLSHRAAGPGAGAVTGWATMAGAYAVAGLAVGGVVAVHSRGLAAGVSRARWPLERSAGGAPAEGGQRHIARGRVVFVGKEGAALGDGEDAVDRHAAGVCGDHVPYPHRLAGRVIQ